MADIAESRSNTKTTEVEGRPCSASPLLDDLDAEAHRELCGSDLESDDDNLRRLVALPPDRQRMVARRCYGYLADSFDRVMAGEESRLTETGDDSKATSR